MVLQKVLRGQASILHLVFTVKQFHCENGLHVPASCAPLLHRMLIEKADSHHYLSPLCNLTDTMHPLTISPLMQGHTPTSSPSAKLCLQWKAALYLLTVPDPFQMWKGLMKQEKLPRAC